MKKKAKRGPVKGTSQKAGAHVFLYADRDKYGDKIAARSDVHGPIDMQLYAVCCYVRSLADHLHITSDAVLTEIGRGIRIIDQQRPIAKVTSTGGAAE